LSADPLGFVTRVTLTNEVPTDNTSTWLGLTVFLSGVTSAPNSTGHSQ
jgi:hypothetical protein